MSAFAPPPVPTEIASGTASADVATSPSLLYGFSLRNGGAGATIVYLRNGAGDDTGDIVAAVELDATGSSGASVTVALPTPVACRDGLRVHRDGSNAVEGSAWLEED